jgi:hypothetical protein
MKWLQANMHLNRNRYYSGFFRTGHSFSTNLGGKHKFGIIEDIISYTNSIDGGIVDGNDQKEQLNLRVHQTLQRNDLWIQN